MKKFLRSAIDDRTFDKGPGSWLSPSQGMQLGSWSDLLHRAVFCDFCRAVGLLLHEDVKKKTTSCDNSIAEKIDFFLGRVRQMHRNDSYDGYSRINVTIRLSNGNSSSYIWLEDAFQVADAFVQEVPERIIPIETAQFMNPLPRLRPELCDPKLVRSWLSCCREHHGSRCKLQPKCSMISLRLVDVNEGRIMLFTQDVDSDIPPYASLSWVWGPAKATDGLTTGQLCHAHEKGFLESIELPLTISDALIFLQGVGVRYLWVDILCIVQDDITDKESYIPLMGSIYAASEFTIVAYGRNGAFDGLPGVRAASRQRMQHVIYCNDLLLVSGIDAKIYPESNEDPEPLWQNRAWTLQEQVLSTRCVIFGSNQMQWECLEASYCEETVFEPFSQGTEPILSPIPSRLSWDGISQADFHCQYIALVETYNRRELSFDSDALFAFLGILNMLGDRTGITFLWGHPIPLFEQHLLWSAPAGRSRCCPEFPSWSWLSYQFSCATSDILWKYAAIRCYTFIEPLDAVDPSVSLKSLHSGDEYRIDGAYENTGAYENRPPSARTVSLEDVPIAILKQIQAYFHILFWADSIRVLVQCKEVRSGIHDGDDLFSLEPGNDDDAARSEGDESCRRRFGDAVCNGHRPDDHGQLKCELVKILSHADTDRSIHPIPALLILEEDGIAKRIGRAAISSYLYDELPWKQKLIVLG